MSAVPKIPTEIPTGTAFAWRVAAFYAALFVVLGVQMPFLPVWLAARGLDAGALGVGLGIPMGVRLLAIPLPTHRARPPAARRAPRGVARCAPPRGSPGPE